MQLSATYCSNLLPSTAISYQLVRVAITGIAITELDIAGVAIPGVAAAGLAIVCVAF